MKKFDPDQDRKQHSKLRLRLFYIFFFASGLKRTALFLPQLFFICLKIKLLFRRVPERTLFLQNKISWLVALIESREVAMQTLFWKSAAVALSL